MSPAEHSPPPKNVGLVGRLTTALVGLVLLAAAVLKVNGPVSAVPLIGEWLSPTWVHLATVQYELFLGVWLVSGRHPVAARLIAALTFSAFAAFSFHGGWVGQASCGCFGAVPLRPWWAFGLDVAVLAALFVTADRPVRPTRRNAGAGLAFAANVALVLAAWSTFAVGRYGSSETAVAVLRGQRLAVGKSVLDLGDVSAGDAASGVVRLRNLSGETVRLLGGTTDCTCTLIQDLPMDIPPGDSRTVTVWFKAPAGAGSFQHAGTIWTDCRRQQAVPITLTGRSVVR